MKPVIGVSSCLLGQQVRFDGGHKNNRYISDVLSEYFEFKPFCPELGIGLGTPRATIRLQQRGDDVIAISNAEDATDHTAALAAYAEQVVPEIEQMVGYVFKKDSPSCGMERVRIYQGENQPPIRDGIGIYAKVVMERYPHLPVEEEGRLQDPRLRENFIERVFMLHDWQTEMSEAPSAGDLVAFHTRHKFAILAHDEPGYRELGKLVAGAGKRDIEECASEYLALLMKTMRRISTPARHANVLMHIMGYFKESLDAADKEELLRLIHLHRDGLVPVIVPITLINYFRKKYPVPYIDGQSYLEPHPPELMLRNTL